MGSAEFAEMVDGGRCAVAPPVAAAGRCDTTRVRSERHTVHLLGAEL